MMDSVRKYMNDLKLFSEEEIEQVIELGTLKELKKGEAFIREGQHCTKTGFIINGIFRSYYTSSKEEEVTYCFRFPSSFLSAYSAYITGNPSVETLEAITDAKILVFAKKDLDELVDNNIKWLRLTKQLAEREYVELEHRIFQLQKENAEVRYNYLLDNQPDYIQSIPLKYLASYLGITQRHLSRIRNSIQR